MRPFLTGALQQTIVWKMNMGENCDKQRTKTIVMPNLLQRVFNIPLPASFAGLFYNSKPLKKSGPARMERYAELLQPIAFLKSNTLLFPCRLNDGKERPVYNKSCKRFIPIGD